MAELEEARQRVQQIRSQLEARRREASGSRKRLMESRKKLGSQQALRRAGGLAGRTQRRIVSKQISQQLQNVQEAERVLQRFEKEQLSPVEANIRKVEQARKDFQLAQKVASGSVPVFALETKQQREFYQQIKGGQEAAVQEAIADIEEQASMSLPSQTREALAKELRETGKATLNLGSQFTADQRNLNLSVPNINIENLDGISLDPATSQVTGVVTAAPNREGTFGGVISKLDRFSSQIQTDKIRGKDISVKDDILRAGAISLSTVLKVLSESSKTGQKLIKDPLTIAKFTGKLATDKQFRSDIGSQIRQQGVRFGRTAREDPLGTTVRVGTDVGIGLLLGKGVSKGAELLTAERIISRSPVPKTTFSVFDDIQPVIRGDSQTSIIKSNIFARTPKRTALVQSRLSQLLRRKPREVVISPEQTRVGVLRLMADESSATGSLATQRRGGTIKNIFEIRSSQQEFNPLDFQKELVPVERRAFERISGVDGMVMVPDEARAFRGSTEARKLVRISGRPDSELTLIFPREGRRTTRTASVSLTQDLPGRPLGGGAFLESPDRFIISKTGSADITFSQRGGKISETKGLSRIKEPISLDDVDDFKVLRPQKTKQKDIKTLQDLSVRQVKEQAKNILGKQSKSRLTASIRGKIDTGIKLDGLPRMVGGTGATSQFSGKNTFERTEGVAFLPPRSENSLSPISSVRGKNILGDSSRGRVSSALRTSSMESSRERQIERLTGVLKILQSTSQNLQPSQSQPSSIKGVQTTAQSQRLISPLSIRPSKRTITRSGTKTGTRTGIGFFPRMKLSSETDKEKDTLISAAKKVIAVTKRRGKEVKIAEGTIEEAFSKGLRRVKGTLAASLTLKTTGGDIISPPEIPVGFRRSKRNPRTIVEELGKRLKSGGEVSEIQMFKEQTPKAPKRLNLFGLGSKRRIKRRRNKRDRKGFKLI